MILAEQNSTEFKLGTKIQAKKPDVGRDQRDKSVAQSWQISFVSCTNNVMQHIDKFSLLVHYVIAVNTSDTHSLNKSHLFSCNSGLKTLECSKFANNKRRKPCYPSARLTSNVNSIQGKSFKLWKEVLSVRRRQAYRRRRQKKQTKPSDCTVLIQSWMFNYF